ncbi:hypothetical protein UA08_05586 [Talaromyces atroroseus]|uniref:Uncharacterized protein n=1 Tax=Talaromyces atroroseus TaxID=1441469 RepID=A0A225ALC9_TALAT|nr:hypothetical protein UA08_05586 [Talaromyces atroroseus]OKL59124.1 hypothetical protein UA08_05586 [Talaromyces atroroseus]
MAAIAPFEAVDVDFLFGLSADTRQYAYTNKRDFLAIKRRECYRLWLLNRSEFIVFHGITEDIYHRDFPDSRLTDTFLPRLGVLLILMPSYTHGVTQGVFSAELLYKLQSMGRLDKSLRFLENAGRRGKDREKQPDKSYQPRRLPRGRSTKWPTLAVEVGYSEDLRKLRLDARWWIENSGGDVRTVIVISVEQDKKEITFEKWGYDQGPTKQFQTMLSEGKNGICATNQSPLTITFEDLLLRPAQGEQEGDISFNTDDLKEMATRIWEMQDEEARMKEKEREGEDEDEEYEEEDENEDEK